MNKQSSVSLISFVVVLTAYFRVHYIFLEIRATPIFHMAVRGDAEWVSCDHLPYQCTLCSRNCHFLFSQ